MFFLCSRKHKLRTADSNELRWATFTLKYLELNLWQFELKTKELMANKYRFMKGMYIFT